MEDQSRSHLKRSRRAVVTALVGIGITGCTARLGNSSEGDESPNRDEGHHPDDLPSDARVEETTVVSDLEVPWDLTFAGDDAFFTERESGVRRIDTEALVSGADLTPEDTDLSLTASDLPNYENLDYSGFLGVAAHPDYPNPPDIYLYHSYDDGEPYNRVIRYDLEREQTTGLVDGIPGSGYHHGGRITFGPEDNLWITTGDANQGKLAQDPASLAGAVLRIAPDGNASPENPTFDADADPRTVTHGHRNPQGIAFRPDGEAFVTEHGPSSRDEVAVVYPGANYGWPTARGGPNDPEYESYDDPDAFTPPVVNTGAETTWAPSGATFYTDDAIEAWKNRLFVCGLISQTLYAITFVRADAADGPPLGTEGVRYDQPWLDDRYTATAHPLYAGAYGRLRHVEQGPNGSVFLLTSNHDGQAPDPFPKADDDRIIRIDPA